MFCIVYLGLTAIAPEYKILNNYNLNVTKNLTNISTKFIEEDDYNYKNLSYLIENVYELKTTLEEINDNLNNNKYHLANVEIKINTKDLPQDFMFLSDTEKLTYVKDNIEIYTNYQD